MTSPEQAVGKAGSSLTELEIIAGLSGKRIDVERLFEKHLDHRHAMDMRAWYYRVFSMIAGLGVFVFLAWFAVRLADSGAPLEAVGVVGFGGLPMVALFVTGEIISKRILK